MEFVVDGRKIFAATGGQPFKPELPTVAFIHGAGMDHTVWTLQTRYFANHGRNVLAIDLPGHGVSEGPPQKSIAELAGWMTRFLDAARVDKAALVGHSMGALAALETASRAPTRVWALVLLGVAERMAVHPDLLKAARAGEHVALDLIAAWGFGRRAHLGGARAPGLWMLGGGVRLLERGQAPALAVDLAACDAYKDALAAADKVRCPTLLLLGDMDRMSPPAAARTLGARIAGARTIVLQDTGHMMMVEQPDQTLDALAETV